MGVQSFEDLECWKACRDLKLWIVREVVPGLPKNEKYRLSDQVLRAARSATANIAEGYGRFHFMDNAKFVSNARGSCWEILDHLITANDEGLVSAELLQTGREKVGSAIRLLNGYITYLRKASATPTKK